jgi:hypothetical protein
MNMKKALFLFGLVVFLFAGTNAQKAEVRNFHGTVNQVQKAIQLAWWSAGDAMFKSQIIEYSTDGVEFKPLVEFPVIDPNGYIYQYIHTTPIIGVNYYRLTLMFTDGGHEYSEAIKVELGVSPIFTYPTYPGKPRPGALPRG